MLDTDNLESRLGNLAMAEMYFGEVRDGVVVFDGQAPPLAPGTKVRIQPIVADEPPAPTLAERLKSVIGSVAGLPPDLAEQHDYYLHGTPKR
jgi:hypothetical protein